jgi:hypothetical protein
VSALLLLNNLRANLDCTVAAASCLLFLCCLCKCAQAVNSIAVMTGGKHCAFSLSSKAPCSRSRVVFSSAVPVLWAGVGGCGSVQQHCLPPKQWLVHVFQRMGNISAAWQRLYNVCACTLLQHHYLWLCLTGFVVEPQDTSPDRSGNGLWGSTAMIALTIACCDS